jgi:hypothetical protein
MNCWRLCRQVIGAPDGAAIVLREIGTEDRAAGDIVTMRAGGQRHCGVLTQGDAVIHTSAATGAIISRFEAIRRSGAMRQVYRVAEIVTEERPC